MTSGACANSLLIIFLGINMKTIVVSLSLAGLMFAGNAMAVDMPADGKAKCGACHAIDKKLVGPAWNDVAAKYKGQADAEKNLDCQYYQGRSVRLENGQHAAKRHGCKRCANRCIGKIHCEFEVIHQVIWHLI